MGHTKLANFQEVMAEEAMRQYDFEIDNEVGKMNRDVAHSSLRVYVGKGNTSTSNRAASLTMKRQESPYRYRNAGTDLIDSIVGANWLIRRALEAYPGSEELKTALSMTTGLGQESSATILKAIPHIGVLIPDYVPDRDLLMKALKQAQEYAEEERECTATALHSVSVV